MNTNTVHGQMRTQEKQQSVTAADYAEGIKKMKLQLQNKKITSG